MTEVKGWGGKDERKSGLSQVKKREREQRKGRGEDAMYSLALFNPTHLFVSLSISLSLFTFLLPPSEHGGLGGLCR